MNEVDHSQVELEREQNHREGLLYVAGMLDGEGSIMLITIVANTPWYVRPRVTITNDNRNALVKCKGVLSCGRIEVSSGGDHFRLAIERRTDIARVLKELLPFLKIKARQARLMLRFLRSDKRDRMVFAHRMRALNSGKKVGGLRK